jgi:hypothetical protein
MKSLEEIESMVSEIAEKINAPISQTLTFGISRDDGTPCVQIERDIYYYIARDRNVISFQKQTRDINELLFWIFYYITSVMANKYELHNRKQGTDHRRISFSYQIELLEKIDSEWARKGRKEIEDILIQFPFDDTISLS